MISKRHVLKVIQISYKISPAVNNNKHCLQNSLQLPNAIQELWSYFHILHLTQLHMRCESFSYSITVSTILWHAAL